MKAPLKTKTVRVLLNNVYLLLFFFSVICNEFHLKNKWNNCFSIFWIIFKFSFVVSMFSRCPHCHLIKSSHCKYKCWHATCHDWKENPCSNFICVIWTRYIAKEIFFYKLFIFFFFEKWRRRRNKKILTWIIVSLDASRELEFYVHVYLLAVNYVEKCVQLNCPIHTTNRLINENS